MNLLLSRFIALPLRAQETIMLRSKEAVDPTSPVEKILERDKDGVIDRSVPNVLQPTITVDLPARHKAKGTAIVICPGGGYEHLAIDKEGHDIARWLNTFLLCLDIEICSAESQP